MENFPFYILIILAFLFLCGALFSAVETALIAVSRHRLKEIAKQKPALAGAIQQWLDNPNKLLTTMLIGINLVAVSTSSLTTRMMETVRHNYDLPLWTVPVISIFIVAVIIIMFGEIIPKILAIHNPVFYTILLIKPIFWFDRLISPGTYVFVGICNAIIRLFGGKPIPGGPFVTEAEILGMVTAGEEQGVIEKDERDMIRSIFEFGDTQVKEVMVPRLDMKCAPADLTISEMAAFIEKTGHSRIPVYEGTLENILGIVNSRDLVRALKEGKDNEPAASIMRPPYFIPEAMMLDDLLRKFQQRRFHLAIIVDEHGATSGLVTLEDLVEEIVGEIRDEYDTEEPIYRWTDEHTLVVNARIDISELNDLLGSKLPEDQDYDTLAGFIFTTLGKVPKAGEKLLHKKMEFTVESMTGRRIITVTIRKPQPPADNLDL
ncbi:MAG: hemolysin family protein [bacterium]